MSAEANIEADRLPQTAMLALLLTMPRERLSALFASGAAAAWPWVKAAADCGLAEAQLCLGRMLLEGRGAPQDRASAIGWFRLAAQAGDAEACNMLGRCLEEGWGAAPDLEAAAAWYRRAAEAGCAWAQYNLGHLHLDGRGVARDAGAAYRWYRRAAEQGHARAMSLVGRCLDEGWGVAVDPAAAREWFRRSAEAGYFRGRYNHATLLAADGHIEEAAALFEAALQDAPPASRRLMVQALRSSAHPALQAVGAHALEDAA